MHTVLATAGATASTPMAVIRQVSKAGLDKGCSFCGKRRQVEAMAAAGDARICTVCLGLCDEIISEEPG